MVQITKIKINGLEFNSDPIDIPINGISLSWDLSDNSDSQSRYSLLISSSNTGHGTEALVPDIANFSSVSNDVRDVRINFRKNLARNSFLFGQLKVFSENGSSDWFIFKVRVANLSIVQSAFISPTNPSIVDNLILNYQINNSNDEVEIKWYKDGVEESIFRNNSSVSYTSLSPGSIWHAEVRSFNKNNNGITFVTSPVEITKPMPLLDGLEILPRDATTDDILEASYSLTDKSDIYNNIQDETLFDWFVNDEMVAESYGRFVRLNVKSGDSVFVRAKPSITGFQGQPVTSNKVFIKKSSITVYDLLVDGQRDGAVSLSPSPSITWNIDEKRIGDIDYFEVKVGTAPGASDVGLFRVDSSGRSFNIPSTLVKKGSEYVITVTPRTLFFVNSNPGVISFRTSGSIWNDEVDNEIGWSFFTKLSVRKRESGAGAPNLCGYTIYVSDGMYSFYISVYVNTIKIVPSSNDVVNFVGDNTTTISLLVGVKGKSLKVYRNGVVIFSNDNALSIISKETFVRFEEIPSPSGTELKLYNFYVSVNGRRIPGDPGYGELSFYKYASFPNCEIDALSQPGGNVLMGVNRLYPDNYPSFYEVNPAGSKVVCDLSSFNSEEFYINKLVSSKIGDVVGIATSSGAAIISGGNPVVWDTFIDSISEEKINSNGWYVSADNMSESVVFASGSLYINTHNTNSSRVIPLVNSGSIQVISIKQKGVFEVYNFSLSGSTVQATPVGNFINQLENLQFVLSSSKTVEQLVNEMLSTLCSSTSGINLSYFYSVSISNEYGNIPSSYISSIENISISAVYSLLIDADAVGVGAENNLPAALPAGGKGGAFLVQDSLGTTWYEKIDSNIGYTFELDLSVGNTLEAIDSSDSISDLANLSFSDGDYYSNIHLSSDMIKIGESVSAIDLSETRRLRFASKNGQLEIYNLDSVSVEPIISHSMNKMDGQIGEITQIKSVSIRNEIHTLALIGNSMRSNFYHKVYKNGEWFSLGKIFEKDADYGMFDICTVGEDIVIAFEMSASGRGEIGVARKSAFGWSKPLRITSEIGESRNPAIVSDAIGGIHVVWEDSRKGEGQILYAHQSESTYQWNSSAFNNNDLELTSSIVYSGKPDISFADGKIYVSYEELDSGISKIFLISKDISSGQWTGYAGSSAPTQVSGSEALFAKKPFLEIDLTGTLHVIWTEEIDNRRRIMTRTFGANLIPQTAVRAITSSSELRDCEIYSVGFDAGSGDIIVLFSKRFLLVDNAGLASDISIDPDISYSLFIIRFDALIRAWRSSGSSGVVRGIPFGGFDIEVITDLTFLSRRSIVGACIPSTFVKDYPLLYVSRKDPESKTVDVVRAIPLKSSYNLTQINMNEDPYLSSGEIIFNGSKDKYIKIGDFGGVASVDMTISRIGIYSKGALAPFAVKSISSASYAMPSLNVSSMIVSSKKDAWLAGDDRLLFFDSTRDDVFDATSGSFFSNSRLDPYIDPGSSISDIYFDKYGRFYVEIENDKKDIMTSLGGSFFFYLKFDFNLRKMRVSKNGDAVCVAEDGIRIIRQFSSIVRERMLQYARYRIDSAPNDPPLELVLPASDLLLDGDFQIYDCVVDGDGAVYFASSKGLIKYDDEYSIGVYGQESGLSQATIKSLSVGINGRIFCATVIDVYEFSGSYFYKIDAFGYERPSSEISPSFDGDIVSIAAAGNFLAIATSQSIYLAMEVSGSGVGSLWSSKIISRSSIDLLRNNKSSSTLRNIFKISDIDIDALGGLSNGMMTEVYINGHKISRGYSFSTLDGVVYLNAPLLASDKISVVLRKDIMKITDLNQKKNEIVDVGMETRKLAETGMIDGMLCYVLNGTRSHLGMWNNELYLPGDDVVLDREPPEGKVTLVDQIDANNIKIKISYNDRGGQGFGEGQWIDAFDQASGIDKVAVSNYENFTTDGATPVVPYGFAEELFHTLMPVGNVGVDQVTITGGYGTAVAAFRFQQGARSKIAYSTGAPAAVYLSNDSGSFDDEPSFLFEGGDVNYEVTCMALYNLKLYCAVSKRGVAEGATIYMTDNGNSFVPLAEFPGFKITAMSRSFFDNKLYFSMHGITGLENIPTGKLYSYDGSGFVLEAEGLGVRANCLQPIDRFVYVGTGSPARIFRYDIIGRNAEIVLSESESDVLSLTTVGPSVYAGLSVSSRIMRSRSVDSPFVQSFVSLPADVTFGTSVEIDGDVNPYFSVGNSLFYKANVWTAISRADNKIVGICSDDNGNVYFISQDKLKSVPGPGRALVRRVFVKLIDKAGNETDIRSLPDANPPETGGDGYNDDLTLIMVQARAAGAFATGGGISNRIVEYDLNGQTLLDIQGDDRFYSCYRIEVETGIYESQPLPGASAHISWQNISWTGNKPAGTDIEILLRSATTRNGLASAPYSVSFSWEESGADISFMPGAYIQFKIILRTTVTVSPRVDSLTITENVGAVSNIITTMFDLPSDMMRGIITADSEIPGGGAIVAGITLQDATDFAQYQEVSLDRLFEPVTSNRGKKLRIGFKLLSPRPSEDILVTLPPSPQDPTVPLSLNTVQWGYQNELTGPTIVDFKVKFYDDINLTEQLIAIDTVSNPSLFKIDGNRFPTNGGAIFASGQSRALSLIPSGLSFDCNRSYFVALEASIDGADYISIDPPKTEFFKQCGVNFLDIITFNYVNKSQSGRFHFKVSFYDDFNRDNLIYSFFSYYSLNGWTANGMQMIVDGIAISTGQSKLIEFVVPRVEDLLDNVTYYITIQAYNLDDPDSGFSFSDTSYSFRFRQISEGINCGPQSNVPVIRGFAMMFELEDGSLVKMRFDG